MVSPYQYPWVDFNRWNIAGIDSTPVLLFGSQAHCIVDSVYITNTSDREIFVDLTRLSEDEDEVQVTTYRRKRFLLKAYESAELIDSTFFLKGGDTIFANSDSTGNLFDCSGSVRVLLETAPIS